MKPATLNFALVTCLTVVLSVCPGTILGDSAGSLPHTRAQTTHGFIPMFVWYYYGIPSGDLQTLLSKFSFSDLSRSSYKDDLGRNTWEVLKSLNPSHEIYLYEFAYGPYDWQDNDSALNINTISRWNNSRGHSMGNLNRDHTEFFLLDKNGNRIHDGDGVWVMDVGLKAYADYWVEAVTADIIGTPWKADGVFIDGPSLLLPPGFSALPIKYPTTEKWASAAISFISRVTVALHKKGVKVWFNVGETRNSSGRQSWVSLDSLAGGPDILLEESIFCSMYGQYFANFNTEDACKSAIDTMQSIKKTRVTIASHVNGLPGDSGIDNFGKPVAYWDALYFALSCFLLGKNTVDNNSYFSWHDMSKGIVWLDEFNINLGNSVGNYQITRYNAVNVYWREYEKGYVYANLSDTDISGIKLKSPCIQVTHENISDPFTGQIKTILDLSAHRGAILIKTEGKNWRSRQVPKLHLLQ